MKAINLGDQVQESDVQLIIRELDKHIKNLKKQHVELFYGMKDPLLKSRIEEIFREIDDKVRKNIQNELIQLKQNFKENHVQYHEIKDLSSLMEVIEVNILSDLSGSEKFLVECLGYPWENPLLEKFKSRTSTVHVISSWCSSSLSLSNLKEFSRTTSVGVTSADMIISETGSILLLDKDRIRGILSIAPTKHVVIVPVGKVVSSYLDSLSMIGKLLCVHSGRGDGHVHVISNPSRTGDIEKIIVYGAHGPLELHVLLINPINYLKACFQSETIPWDLVRFSSLVEGTLSWIFPWLRFLTMKYGIPLVDLISVAWFLEHATPRRMLAYHLLLRLLCGLTFRLELASSMNQFYELVRILEEMLARKLMTKKVKTDILRHFSELMNDILSKLIE